MKISNKSSWLIAAIIIAALIGVMAFLDIDSGRQINWLNIIGVIILIIAYTIIMCLIFKVPLSQPKFFDEYLIYKKEKIKYSSIVDIKIHEIVFDEGGATYLEWTTKDGKKIYSHLKSLSNKNIELYKKIINGSKTISPAVKKKALNCIEKQIATKAKLTKILLITGAVALFIILIIYLIFSSY